MNWEEEKKERRRLRGRQRSAKHSFFKDIDSLNDNLWKYHSEKFSELLIEDSKLDPYWIDTDRYLIAIYNLFKTLGFDLYIGNIPRVSGIEPEYRNPILAIDGKRALLIENNPSYLFADLADIQPLCPYPIVGLLYNSVTTTNFRKNNWGYVEKSVKEYKRIAGALALGYIYIDYNTLLSLIKLHPVNQKNEILKIITHLGLIDFLNPSIDSLPLYGNYVSLNNSLPYKIDNFQKDYSNTKKVGSNITLGNITQATPDEAVDNSEYYFKELKRSKLISGDKDLLLTNNGWSYLRNNILPFPIGQLLYSTCYIAREEIKKLASSAFNESLKSKKNHFMQSYSLFIPIDNFDSFSRISLIPTSFIAELLPLNNSEAEIKKIFCDVMGDPFEKKDWGGEQNDIFSTRISLNGERKICAFFLKGPATKGKLTIAKCGKNGDQIQRLFQSPADVFVIQYNGEIDERVIEECRQKTSNLRNQGNNSAVFSVIDGADTAKIIKAYL